LNVKVVGKSEKIATDINSFFADFFCADLSVLFFSRIPVFGVVDFFSDTELSGTSPLSPSAAGDGDLLLAFGYI